MYISNIDISLEFVFSYCLRRTNFIWDTQASVGYSSIKLLDLQYLRASSLSKTRRRRLKSVLFVYLTGWLFVCGRKLQYSTFQKPCRFYRTLMFSTQFPCKRRDWYVWYSYPSVATFLPTPGVSQPSSAC